jgi:hypothetical protein
MLAGVGQVMAGGCWKITLPVPVTLLEKLGLEAVAVMVPVVVLVDV